MCRCSGWAKGQAGPANLPVPAAVHTGLVYKHYGREIIASAMQLPADHADVQARAWRHAGSAAMWLPLVMGPVLAKHGVLSHC